jgi:hypothetical protein
MGTVEWLFIIGGVVMIALAAGALGQDAGPQRNLDAVLAVLGVWSIVQAIVFTGTTLEWVAFATGAAAALLATVGLTLHEMTTERVVHELSVITDDERAGRPAQV